MEEWVRLISNVGFPIAMVAYFVFRMEKILKEHTEAITTLLEFMRGQVK